MKWHSVGVGGTRCPCGHQSEVQIRSSLPECHIKAARKSALATVVSVASLVTEPYQHSTSPQQSSPHIFSVPGLPPSHLSPFPLPPPSTDQHNQTSRLIVPGSWRGRYPAQSTVRYCGVVHNCYHQDVCKLHNCLVHSANLVLL